MKKNMTCLLFIISFSLFSHYLFSYDQFTLVFINNEEKTYPAHEIKTIAQYSKTLEDILEEAETAFPLKKELKGKPLEIHLPQLYLREFELIHKLLLADSPDYNKELYAYYRMYGPQGYNHFKRAVRFFDIIQIANNLLLPTTEDVARAIWQVHKGSAPSTYLKEDKSYFSQIKNYLYSMFDYLKSYVR